MAFNKFDKKMAISRIPQTDYTTVVTPAASTYVEQITTDLPFWTQTPDKESNKGHSTGNRFATESYVKSWDTQMSMNFEASSQNLGRFLYAAMGAVSSAQQGVTTAYKHTFTPLNLANGMQLPVYTWLQMLAESNNGINELYPSAVCESLELTGSGTGRVTASANWRGSGEKTTPSGVTWATHVTASQNAQNFFHNPMAGIRVGTYSSFGSPIDYQCNVQSWKFGITNQLALEDGYRPGCPRFLDAAEPEKGVMRSECLLLDTDFSAEYTLRMRADDPEFAALQSQAQLELEISLTGKEITAPYNHKLLIRSYLMKYNTVVRGEGNNIVLVTVTPEFLYSRSDSKIIDIELTNNVTSYTT